MFDAGLRALPPGTALPDDTLGGELRRLAGEVDGLSRPNEDQFLAVGRVLGASVDTLQGLEEDFAALTALLESPQAQTFADALGRAMERTAAVDTASSGIITGLERAEQAIGAATTPLTRLAMIITEVGALAVNAKIQAATIGREGLDFTVFTREIGRLQGVASRSVQTAMDHSHELGRLIAEARELEANARDDETTAIAQARIRLDDGIRAMVARRSGAGASMASIHRRARTIAAEISDCVARMQINDLTSQRLGHVRDALDLLSRMLIGGADEDIAWAGDMDALRKRALVAAVCRLQAQQLRRAARDFAADVTRLEAVIRALAGEVTAVAAETAAMFNADEGGSFVHELCSHADHAAGLLRAFAGSQERLRAMVTKVVAGLGNMADDIAAIHALDADMRVMGLNASFRCSRLGTAGRTLGVVAQELRSCSHRTEEVSQMVAAAMAGAGAATRDLASLLAASQDDATGMATSMRESLAALTSMDEAIGEALDRLLGTWGSLARHLAGSADGITVHRGIEAAAERIASALDHAAALAGDGDADADTVQLDLRRLLEERYTMASERVIHSLFAEPGQADGPVEAESAGSIDFF
jgi:hypothetical protein